MNGKSARMITRSITDIYLAFQPSRCAIKFVQVALVPVLVDGSHPDVFAVEIHALHVIKRSIESEHFDWLSAFNSNDLGSCGLRLSFSLPLSAQKGKEAQAANQ